MSVLSGLWHLDGAPLDKERLSRIADLASQHGPDGRSPYFTESIGMIFQLFDSGTAVGRGRQPHLSPAGTVLMWDGRLDNRNDLLALLKQEPPHMGNQPASDIAIIHAVYDEYGPQCFGRIVGDWAMCVWEPRTRRLMLSCDFIGVRPLYYCRLNNALLWCSDLSALVRGADISLHVCDLYIAEYLEALPRPDLTPYEEIRAVAPGTWLEISERDSGAHQYWTWNTENPIRHNSDREYEEHFRYEFRRSIQRRLQTDHAVMAELSGGIDSSSIVCIADEILDSGEAVTPALHTLSYYHDEEPGCDERPYFAVIENKRGRVGTHINSARYETLTLEWPLFVPVPVFPHGLFESEAELCESMASHSALTILSGLGGDEFLGGVPTGIPELADLLHLHEIGAFRNSLSHWSKVHRTSRWSLIRSTLRAVLAQSPHDRSRFTRRKTSIASPELRRRAPLPAADHSHVLCGGAMPSQRMFAEAWLLIQRQVAYLPRPLYGCYHRTYPYLDRDLMVFLFNIPRTQIIRAGQRRSLIRRALDSLVPHENLWRKDKATSVRRYMRLFARHSAEIGACLHEPSVSKELGDYIDLKRTEAALSYASNGMAVYNWPVMRIVGATLWLMMATGYLALAARHQGTGMAPSR